MLADAKRHPDDLVEETFQFNSLKNEPGNFVSMVVISRRNYTPVKVVLPLPLITLEMDTYPNADSGRVTMPTWLGKNKELFLFNEQLPLPE